MNSSLKNKDHGGIATERELFNEALALRDDGKFHEAKTILLGFTERYPAVAAPHGVLGGIHLQLREYAEAVNFFRKATEINPRSELASRGLIHSLLGEGNHDLALDELGRYSRVFGPTAEADEMRREIEADRRGR